MDKPPKDDKERLIDQLEESKQTELKPFFVDIRNIGLNNEKDGYVIRKEWNGQAVKKADLEKVEEIISKYEPKSSEIDNKGAIESNYKTIGYADVILEGKLNTKFISTSPREDTVYEILQDSNGKIKLGIWKDAEKRVLNCPDFVDGCDKQRVAQKPDRLNVKLGDLQKNDEGGYIVTTIPIVKFVDKPEEKDEQPEVQKTPEVSEPLVTIEEKDENEKVPKVSQEEVKEEVHEAPVVEGATETQIENLVSEKEWRDFLNNTTITEHTIKNITEKIKNNKELSKKEETIRKYYELQQATGVANRAYAKAIYEKLGLSYSDSNIFRDIPIAEIEKTKFYKENSDLIIKNLTHWKLTVEKVKSVVLHPVYSNGKGWVQVNIKTEDSNIILAQIELPLDENLISLGKETEKAEQEFDNYHSDVKSLREGVKEEKDEENTEDLKKKELLKNTINDFKKLILTYNKLYLELNEEKRQLQELIEKRELELQSTPENEIIKEDLTIDQAIELLKNNKINQIIIAGDYNKKTEEMRELKPDLDTLGALYLLNNLNKKPIGEVYADGAVTSVVGKGGEGKELIEDKEGLIVSLDTGGEWLSIEKDGEKKTLYIDHHGSGKRESTSGTKMIYEIMKNSETLDEKPWISNFVKFVNDVDNLEYIRSKNFTENYLINSWPQSLYALAEKHIPFQKVVELFENGTIKDPSLPFTDEQIKNNIGNLDIKKIAQETRKQIKDTLDGIKNSIKHNKERGLNLDNETFGKIIYHDYFKVKNHVNTIIDHLAIKAIAAKGYDTYIVYSKKPPRIYVNTLKKDLDLKKSAKKLSSVLGSRVKDVRGTFIFKDIDINKFTEKQFLDAIDPNILKDVKY